MQENIKYLREIYSRLALKIIDDPEELMMIKNNLMIEMKQFPDDTMSAKVYYLYCIKLNKFFHLYDASYPLEKIIVKVLTAEPDNIYFQAEKLWLEFSAADDKRAHFEAKLKEF